MLRSLFGQLLSAADYVVEAYRRPATSPERGHDVHTSPQGWQTQHHQALFATPTAKQSAGKISTLATQSIPCKWPPSAGSSRARWPVWCLSKVVSTWSSLLNAQAPWTSGNCSIPRAPAAKTTSYGAKQATGEPVSTFCAAEAPGEMPHRSRS